MARYASYGLGKPCPHSVTLRGEIDAVGINNWLRSRRGWVRFDRAAFATVFWFSNQNTAFEFKMRWG